VKDTDTNVHIVKGNSADRVPLLKQQARGEVAGNIEVSHHSRCCFTTDRNVSEPTPGELYE